MSGSILVLNTGSSSIKFQLFAIEAGSRLARRIKGQVDGIGTHPRLRAAGEDGIPLADTAWQPDEVGTVPAALERVETWLLGRLDGIPPTAIGHRVVHGGPDYSAPTLIDDAVLARLERLVPLAPLHQPNNLLAIRTVRQRRPDLPQVACFDTAFHHGHAEPAQRFAIPDALHREGVRRYGFHGLSYEFIARRLPEVAPAVGQVKVIVAHLGSGASMCALQDGRSVDSTMGFTALDGLPMGTRSGQIDPGVLLYLLGKPGWDPVRLEHFLYSDCGLKGLSGISNDMRDLLDSTAPLAGLAVDYFVFRILREAGALAAVLGGLDAFVFTAGIGEKATAVRSRVGQGLAWLGLEMDEAANARHGPCISTAGSRVSAWVVPTDEELMIARHTLECVEAGRGADLPRRGSCPQ